MAKQSILTDAKETVVEAGKTAAEGVKNVATDALVAGAAAAAGVVAERVSQGLRATENKMQRALPSREGAGRVAERALKPPARGKAAGKGRRAAAKKAATSRKTPAAAKKRAATPSEKKAAARKAAATRKTGTRKAGRKSAKRRTR
jgi:hypothetical protein